MSADQVAQLLAENVARSPSSIAALMAGAGSTPGPELVFWAEAPAAVQQNTASTAANLIQDGLATDPSGWTAYNAIVAYLGRLIHRQL